MERRASPPVVLWCPGCAQRRVFRTVVPMAEEQGGAVGRPAEARAAGLRGRSAARCSACHGVWAFALRERVGKQVVFEGWTPAPPGPPPPGVEGLDVRQVGAPE